MNIQPIDAPAIETITLPKATDLRRVAEWIGIPVQDLQDLNPELRRWTTPVRMDDYELKVPQRRRPTAVKAQARRSDAGRLRVAELPDGQEGRDAALDRAQAQREPDGSGGSQLPVGHGAADRRAAAGHSARADAAAGGARRQSDPRDRVALGRCRRRLQRRGAEGRTRPCRYRSSTASRRGETLASIARLYSTTVASLKQWNHLKGTTIAAGQRLTILQTRRSDATH